MLTKEICTQALNDMKMYGGINIPPLAFDIIDRLIEEHFNPKPLKFKNLKEGMYIWDNELKQCGKVDETYIHIEGGRGFFTAMSTRWIAYENGFRGKVAFEENRFYPITIPKVMEE